MEDYHEPAQNNPAGDWYISNPMEALLGSKIALEDGITSVGNYAFYLPTMYGMVLQTYNLDLPNSLTKIGDHAFQNQNKLQKLAIPKHVSSIGVDAFKDCKMVQHVDIYGNPLEMTWNANYFGSNVTCHVLPKYADNIETIKSRFKTNMTFEANLHANQGLVDDDVERNIKAYFATESTKVFGGAAPFVIVGTFSGDKKSVTHGNNGFVSCVQVGNDYYVQSSNQSGDLNKATVAGAGGYVTGLDATAHSDLRLVLTREYIGKNIVKIIYTLKNTSTNKTYSNLKLGSTGDIKIGADDYAAIQPLKETIDNKETQVGFYMKSNNVFDNSGEEFATLGFIGKNVSDSSEEATFFYGKAAANSTDSATGAFRMRMMPQRIFEKGTGAQTEGTLSGNLDSGMSYYWDDIELAPNTEKTFAVLFSVYGATNNTQGNEMLEEQTKHYDTVVWKNWDESVLLKQLVEGTETHEVKHTYPLEDPVKPEDNQHYYEFFGWDWKLIENEENHIFEYTAQYTEKQKSFFKGHSLTLQGDIGVYFYIDPKVAEKDKYNNGTEITEESVKDGTTKISVKFSWYDKNSEYQIRTGEADYDTETGLFKARCNVAAAEMAYDIHAVAYINGKRYEEEENHYSVMLYGQSIITPPEGTTYDANLVKLAQTMLDYGAKSQVVFDRTKNTNGTSIPMANEKVGDYQMAVHSLGNTLPAIHAGLEEYGLAYYGASVVFLSKTTLRQYYRITDQEKFDSFFASLSAEDKKKFVKNGTLYYLQVEDIAAEKLDERQRFTVGASTYQFSVLDYALVLQLKGGEAERNLGTALYWYNEAANAYYGNTN